MTKLIFLRHGESEYNRIKKYTGQLDVPLTELGKQQAKIAGAYIVENYKIDEIYASDLSRATETAQPVADVLQLPIYTDKRLRELDLGEWTDQYIDEVKEKYTAEFLSYKQGGSCVGGESFLDVQRRAQECVLEIAKRHYSKTVLIATHGGVIRALLSVWLHYPQNEFEKVPLVSNNSLTFVEYFNEQFVVKDIAYDGYLDLLRTEQDKDLI